MKRDLVTAVVAIAIVAAALYGLHAWKGELPPPPPSPPIGSHAAAAKSAPSANDPANAMVMRVNGQPVTEREFELFVSSAPQQIQQMYTSGPQGRALAAQELVKMIVLEQEGGRKGLDKDPQVTAQLEWARANLTAAKALQDLGGQPTDAEIRAAYEKEKPRFTQMQLSHILVAVEGGAVKARGGAPTPSPEQGMLKALAIEKQVREGGEFGAYAREFSDDVQSAMRGGDVGPVAAESLPAELQPVLQLKENEISKPIRSSMGIHIFKGGKRTVAPFEQVKPYLAQQLRQQKAIAETEKLSHAAKVQFEPGFLGGASAPMNAPPPAHP